MNKLEKSTVRNEVVDSARDLLSAKITLPLGGNTNLKKVHTNQFLFTDLPDDFPLENFATIAKALNSSDTRFSSYVENRWYNEGITINNDGSNFTMEIEINPFATTITDYKDDKASMVEEYEQAIQQAQQAEQSASSTSVASVTTENTGLRGGQGDTIDKLVKKIVGNETRDYHKMKKIHEWLLKNRDYHGYSNCKYCTPEKAYKNRYHINCADTSILTRSMMDSAGLDAWIVHGNHYSSSGKRTGHYWTQIKVNGKTYNSDAVSKKNTLNKVWNGLKPDRKCGKKPC